MNTPNPNLVMVAMEDLGLNPLDDGDITRVEQALEIVGSQQSMNGRLMAAIYCAIKKKTSETKLADLQSAEDLS